MEAPLLPVLSIAALFATNAVASVLEPRLLPVVTPLPVPVLLLPEQILEHPLLSVVIPRRPIIIAALLPIAALLSLTKRPVAVLLATVAVALE